LTDNRKFVHDMKNMLGIVIGFSELLLDDLAADDPKRADVAEIRKAGEHALVLLNGWNNSPPPEELT
jgi:signal transduction histidine kinase